MDNENDDSDIKGISEDDLKDINLLKMQASGLLLEAYAYILLYSSSLEAIEVIKNKYRKQPIEGIDPDIPSVEAAKILLTSQTLLLKISSIQYANFAQEYADKDLNAAKSATYELFLADFLEELAYTFYYIGVHTIYKINNEGPISGN